MHAKINKALRLRLL